MAERWRGIFTILVTPFHEDRSLDEPGPRRCGLFATTACRKADPDLADEMVRKDLGLVRADEVVVPLED